MLKVLEEGHTQGVQGNSKGRKDRTAHTHTHKSTWHPHNTSPQLPPRSPPPAQDGIYLLPIYIQRVSLLSSFYFLDP